MATWRPPERIKYAPLEAPWPTAFQAEQSQLFQPIRVGSLRLAARTWVPAMVPWRASEAGDVTPSVLAWYERFARGRPAALVVRTDGYGGAPEQRIRLPLEVLAAVRDQVGSAFPVGCRMLAEDCIESGSTVEDTEYFAERLAGAGMDFISLSRGGKFEDASQPKIGEAAYPYTGRSGYECMPSYYSDSKGPFGRNVDACSRIRSKIRKAGFNTPIVLSGGIHHFNQAEHALRSGAADIVGFARQALADPDWFLKVREGRGAKVRLCLYTNYCEALDQRHREVTCELWDRTNLDEPGTMLSADGKRRLLPP